MWNFASPSVFLALTRRLLPWSRCATAALFALGLYLSFVAPPDYQQGVTVKIMYIHVPAAWLSTFIYGVMALASLARWSAPSARRRRAEGRRAARRRLHLHLPRHRVAVGQADVGDLLGLGRAPHLGAGAVHPLSGLIALWRAIEDPGRAARAAAILTLVGCVNLPIIKFSVDWWNTLHQPASVFRAGGPTIAPELLWPLLVMALAFTLLFLALHLMAIRNEILRRRLARLTMIAAAEGEVAASGDGGRRHDGGPAFRLRRRRLRTRCAGDRRHDRFDPLGLSRAEQGSCRLEPRAERDAAHERSRSAPRRRGVLATLPLILFAALAVLLFVRLFAGDASRIPSALIGQSAPALDLPGLDGGRASPTSTCATAASAWSMSSLRGACRATTNTNTSCRSPPIPP